MQQNPSLEATAKIEQVIRVYLAGPGRKPEEAEILRSLEALLEDAHISVYSPFRDGITLAPDASPAVRSEVFRSNVEAIDKCDIVVAVIDDFDPGTIFEMGFASAFSYLANLGFGYLGLQNDWNYLPKKPIIACTRVMGRGLNVMLERACVAFTDDLKRVPVLVKDRSLWKDSMWIGTTE